MPSRSSSRVTRRRDNPAPGRSDALVVRHDLVAGDRAHAIATRSGMTYTISVEQGLRNLGNEKRNVGVANGYSVSYETTTTLEAAHVDFAAAVGTVVPHGALGAPTGHRTVRSVRRPDTARCARCADRTPHGALGAPTGHRTVVTADAANAVWLDDGLEIARLCG